MGLGLKESSKKSKRIIILVIGIFIGIGVLGSFLDKRVESIELTSNIMEYDINNIYEIGYELEPADAQKEPIKFITSDKDIVSLRKMDKSEIKINTHKEGVATLYLTYESGKSNRLTIHVVDKQKK